MEFPSVVQNTFFSKLEAASLLHELINDISRRKRLAGQIINVLLLELMQKDVIENDEQLAVLLACLDGGMRGQDETRSC